MCPDNIDANVTMGSNSSAVNWTVSASDIVDGVVNSTCWVTVDSVQVEVTSGHDFDVGDTLVTCEASDAANNTAMCGFNVTVKGKSKTVYILKKV